MSEIIGYKEVEEKVLVLRDQHVILDRDVAVLYDVATKEVNQAVKNNPGKFPDGYVVRLSSQEKDELVKKFDHLETLKHSPTTSTCRSDYPVGRSDNPGKVL